MHIKSFGILVAASILPLAGASVGQQALPQTPCDEPYHCQPVLYTYDATVCDLPDYWCETGPLYLMLYDTPTGWMAELHTTAWNTHGLFGPMEGSPADGFWYENDDPQNGPIWICAGGALVEFYADPGMGYFVLNLHRDGFSTGHEDRKCSLLTVEGYLS